MDGTVKVSNSEPGGSMTIDHGNGFETFYYHMNKNLMKVGDVVHAGDQIGEVGKKKTQVSHLHFATRKSGVGVDPEPILGAMGVETERKGGIAEHRLSAAAEEGKSLPEYMYADSITPQITSQSTIPTLPQVDNTATKDGAGSPETSKSESKPVGGIVNAPTLNSPIYNSPTVINNHTTVVSNSDKSAEILQLS
jgi:Membrane-bound metallopeptidase